MSLISTIREDVIWIRALLRNELTEDEIKEGVPIIQENLKVLLKSIAGLILIVAIIVAALKGC